MEESLTKPKAKKKNVPLVAFTLAGRPIFHTPKAYFTSGAAGYFTLSGKAAQYFTYPKKRREP